jgi:SAM-dependent methyltransferase
MHPRLRTSFWNRHIRTRWRLLRKLGPAHLLTPADRKKCNICGYSGQFIPFAADNPVYPKTLQCPRCKSSNRHRLIIFFLERHLPRIFSEGMHVLHFAPELSLGGIFRAIPTLRYETADWAAKGVDHLFDLQKESLAANSFDVVLANHILEHIPDDMAALRNILHMLKPGGLAIVTVPVRVDSEETDDDPTVVDPAERQLRFGASDHLRFYGRDLVKRIEQAGFVASTWEPSPGVDIDCFAMDGETLFLGVKGKEA